MGTLVAIGEDQVDLDDLTMLRNWAREIYKWVWGSDHSPPGPLHHLHPGRQVLIRLSAKYPTTTAAVFRRLERARDACAAYRRAGSERAPAHVWQEYVECVWAIRGDLLAAIEAVAQDHPDLQPRLRVSVADDQAILDGKPFALVGQQALFLQALIAADGDWKTGDQLGLGDNMRPDRIRKGLPKPLELAVESRRGLGYRVKSEYLLR